jgi:hypothetical protein
MVNAGVLCLVLLSLFIASCNEQPSNFNVKTRELSFRNKTKDVIHGKAIMEVPGVRDILLIDSLFLFPTIDPAGGLKVYSANTFRLLGSFCKEGRARNEFQRGRLLTKQVYHNQDGHVILPFCDAPTIVKEVDVTESILQGHTVVLSVMDNEGNTVFLDNAMNKRFVFISNKFEYDDEKNDVPSIYALKDTLGNARTFKIFNSMVDHISEKYFTAPYRGALYKHPHRNLVVQTFSYMEYLLFFDFDKDLIYATHEKSALSFDGVYDKSVRRDNDFAFTDGTSTDNYILVLYWRGDYYFNVPNREGPNELLVFDWDGNYINGFKMDRQILRIEYDEKRHILYAIDDNETLYRYDMTGLID